MKKVMLMVLNFSFILISNSIAKDNFDYLTQKMRTEYAEFRDKKNRTSKEQFKNIATNVFGFSSITEQDCPTLYNMVKDLSKEMNLPMPSVNVFSGNILNTISYSIMGHDLRANAFVPATAIIYNFGRIIIGEKTLNCLDYVELRSVVAHELAHIYHYHILKRMGLGLSINGMSNGLIADKSNLFLLRYFISQIILNAYSRSQEKEADITSLKIVKNPNDLINALNKLENLNDINCLRKIIEDLMRSHPTNSEREKYLKVEAALLGSKKSA